jgi:hypothetical protein
MKPFDLEKALAGEPVVTRDGQKIIDIHYFKYVKTKFPLVVHIENNSSVDHYTIKGKWTEDFENEELDLFMYEPLIEMWVNLYQSGNEISIGALYKTEELAKQEVYIKDGITYIKTIKITNES